MRLLLGHDTTIAEWVGDKIGVSIAPPYTALGWIDDEGTLRVGFVFHSYIPAGSIEIAVAASGRLTRGIMAEVGAYAFGQCGARRITARTRRADERACSILVRIGFVKETVCKHYYANDDAVQFRLLRKDAMRWLR